jgi:hypothetical protein
MHLNTATYLFGFLSIFASTTCAASIGAQDTQMVLGPPKMGLSPWNLGVTVYAGDSDTVISKGAPLDEVYSTMSAAHLSEPHSRFLIFSLASRLWKTTNPRCR